ncbi:MAG: hypothetical protein HOA38_06085 [Candidatus Marinimicrobia bacterium]|jgi:hypothetical protein|nr:hypothetical protein [Candidatus Neomarinimicrobiota bacterium]
MNNKEVKQLAISLAKSGTEEEAVKVLIEAGLWDNNEAWEEFDGSSGNWSTIGNQQSEADSALVEKVINAVDAVFIRECLKSGIDPESIDTPDSIQSAQKKYFNIFNGKLSSIDAAQRNRIADNIYLVASGSKIPSIDIVDLGEGQPPSSFKDTFLSLNRGNKNKIQFVQGKFGMGGTGVFAFGSKKHNLQLIISKRNQELQDSDEKWGVTVIRRIRPTGQMKTSVFKYLAPEGGVLSFHSNALPLLPDDDRKAYNKEIHYGSFIKIYDYQLKTGRLRSDITRHLWNRLSLLMPDIALPIKVVDTRHKKSPIKVLSGLSVRLDEDKKNLLEDGFPGSGEMVIDGQRISYSIYAFKEGVTKQGKKESKKETYAPKEGAILTVNGQTHGSIPKSFFNRKSVGMSYLSDSILVTLDCSQTEGFWREQLFMNSRDKMRGGPEQNEILKELEMIVKAHPGLKTLREQRRREAVEDVLGDSKPLAEVLEKIVRRSPSLSALLLEGSRINNPFKLTGAVTVAKEFNGKEYPSYFKLKKIFTEDSPKKCELDRKFRIQFETDVENNYFERDRSPGNFSIKIDDILIKEYTMNLWNGLATLNIKIPEGTDVNDNLHFLTEVTDETQIDSFLNNFWIEVIGVKDRASHKPGERKEKPGDNDGKDRQKEAGLDIPTPIPIKKEKWDKYGFDRNSALKVTYAGEGLGYDFFLNMDNVYLKSELRNNNKTDVKMIEARYTYGMTLIGLSLLSYDKNHKRSENEPSIEDSIFSSTSAISPVLLPMIGALGNLEIE